MPIAVLANLTGQTVTIIFIDADEEKEIAGKVRSYTELPDGVEYNLEDGPNGTHTVIVPSGHRLRFSDGRVVRVGFPKPGPGFDAGLAQRMADAGAVAKAVDIVDAKKKN